MITPNQGETHFTGLLGLYLRQRQVEKNSNQQHLDEDILSAFVEGALTEHQAMPVLKHLIDCVFCRRVTAQLAELSESFDEVPYKANTTKTSNWRELWSNLTESVSRSYDNAVTAHEEEKENDETREKDPSEE